MRRLWLDFISDWLPMGLILAAFPGAVALAVVSIGS
jgi:hypothetical protein